MATIASATLWRSKQLLLIVLMDTLAVAGSIMPGEAGSRDHHRGGRSHIEQRVGDHPIVRHGSRHAEHRVVRSRVVVDRRHRGDRPRMEHRIGDRYVVDRWSPGQEHRVHHRYPGKDHRVVHDRVVVYHRYPPIGHRPWGVPRWEAAFVIGGLSYYYFEGAFYRPWGVGYVAVAAPIGACVYVLPPACSVVYVGATRYYYGNGAYYLWDAARAGYVVVPRPAEVGETPAEGGVPTVFIYPKAGQNAALPEQDRQECEEWATAETGIDPRHETGEAGKRDDYVRAMTACLEGREYTVK